MARNDKMPVVDGNVQPVDEYGKKYKDPVEGMPEGERLPLNAYPKGPDPQTFNIIGGGTGER
jgi:hypothetical protein